MIHSNCPQDCVNETHVPHPPGLIVKARNADIESAVPQISEDEMSRFYADGVVLSPEDIVQPASRLRRMWTSLVWALTVWIPTVLIDKIGLIKQSAAIIAWREKVATCLLLGTLNGALIFANIYGGTRVLFIMAIIVSSVNILKLISAMTLGSKSMPGEQDRFILCLVPIFTEVKDELKAALESIAATKYNYTRKLVVIVSDGIVTGKGNDQTTHDILLDLLGLREAPTPTPLIYESLGIGPLKYNYAMVYSGLYETSSADNVLPFVYIAKTGTTSEEGSARRGNRGKRDTHALILQFLNRVHHGSPMTPLDLGIFHHIENIIGVDPELYEFLLMIDADTVIGDSSILHLVASCVKDPKIAGICGEVSFHNEEKSWWTMIQVWEIFNSHHSNKASESLFGSVTCLPGCFSMYRLKRADKGKPLVICDDVLKEFMTAVVDTLHMKNTIDLGEDRYLTTIMRLKFPEILFKFVPGALAQTSAPDTFQIFLSQRRRWMNSAIHNTVELLLRRNWGGFSGIFRNIPVIINFFGSLTLPAIAVSFVYLVYVVASRSSSRDSTIALCLVGASYAFMSLMYLIKRQWQYVVWMIIYLISFPVWNLVIPIYALWKQDDYDWGATRIISSEGIAKGEILDVQDLAEQPVVKMQTWQEYAIANHLPYRAP